jgi:plasmid stability protein
MPTLTIRALPDAVRDRLRVRAAKRGVSMEAEVRAILTETVFPKKEVPDASSIAELQDWVGAQRKKSRAAKAGSNTLIRDRRRDVILEALAGGQEPAKVFGPNYRRVLAEAEWSEADVRAMAKGSR